MDSSFEPTSAVITGFILLAIVVGYLLAFSIKQGKGIVEGLKGDNGKWDPPEVVIAVWLFLFPTTVLADVFLQFVASDKVWYGLDLILFFALAGRIGLDYVHKNKKDA